MDTKILIPDDIINKIFTYGIVSYPFLTDIQQVVTDIHWRRMEISVSVEEWEDLEKAWNIIPVENRTKKIYKEVLLEIILRKVLGCFYVHIDYVDETLPKDVLDVYDQDIFYSSLLEIRDEYNLDIETSYRIVNDSYCIRFLSINNKRFKILS